MRVSISKVSFLTNKSDDSRHRGLEENGFFQEGGRDCSKQALKRGETGVNEKETVQL